MPPLEAMACGTAVLTTNYSSLPEVDGDAAAFVSEPWREEKVAEALKRLMSDAALRSHLAQSGIRRACLFSWEETGRRTLDLIEDTAHL